MEWTRNVAIKIKSAFYILIGRYDVLLGALGISSSIFSVIIFFISQKQMTLNNIKIKF